MIRAAALMMLLCGCATTPGAQEMEGHPMRKGDPEPVYEFEYVPGVPSVKMARALP